MLFRRLAMNNVESSAIVRHLQSKYNCPPSEVREILVSNAQIIHYETNVKKLKILEAVYIRTQKPALNRVTYKSIQNILKCLS